MATFSETINDTLTLSDGVTAAIPYAFVTDSVRTSVSMQLRLQRRPWRWVEITLPLAFSDVEPGSTLWFDHKLMPGYAVTTDNGLWRLIPLLVVEVNDPISPAEVRLKCLDLREVYCTLWSPLKTDIGMTADLNGIAMLDQGGGWQTERDQLGYGPRPGGDFVMQEVLANTPIVDADGLLIEGGGDTNHLLNSTFSEGSGDTFTSWTKTTSGAAIGVGWTLYTLIDANGFRRAVQLATYATGEAAYLSQSVASMGGKRLFLKVYYKNGGAVDDLVYRIQRSDTSEWWQDSDQSWQGSPISNPITPNSGVLASLLATSKMIDLTADTTNLTVDVGHISAAFNGGQITQLQGVELIESPYNADFAKYRSPLPTKAAAVTRVPNQTWFVNDSAVRVLTRTRGFLKCTFRPSWSNEDLVAGGSISKYLWAVDQLGLACVYYALDGSTAYWQLINSLGQYAQLEGPLAVRDEEYVVVCRWTSSAENEQDLVGQAYDIWVDGVRGSTYESTPEVGLGAESRLYMGRSIDADTDGNGYADGHITSLTVGDHCPTEAELMRL